MFSYGSESAWRHVGWHQIEQGGWNAETHKLSWSTYDGVSASIVAERFVPIAGERGVTVSGRRDLAEASPAITWHQTLGRGLSWNSDEVREAANVALAELQAEYGML
jgi:hypothetical protein